MKKAFIHLFLLTIMPLCAAMEIRKLQDTNLMLSIVPHLVIYPVSLSREEDDKALRIAKLFHHHKYGRNRAEKTVCATNIKLFFKQKNHFTLHVRKYCALLKREKKVVAEILHCLFNDNFPGDLKALIFTFLVYPDAQQYYALRNALQFIQIGQRRLNAKSQCAHDIRIHKELFFGEISKNHNVKGYFADIDESIELDDIVVADYHFDGKGMCGYLRIEAPKRIIEELILFLHEDTKKARVQQFETSLKRRITNIATLKTEQCLDQFLTLFTQLQKHKYITDFTYADVVKSGITNLTPITLEELLPNL